MQRIIEIGAVVVVVGGLLLLAFFGSEVKAQSCLTEKTAAENVTSFGGIWLGSGPDTEHSTDEGHFSYYAVKGIVYAIIVWSNGCVYPDGALPIGPLDEKPATERPAVNGTPA